MFTVCEGPVKLFRLSGAHCSGQMYKQNDITKIDYYSLWCHKITSSGKECGTDYFFKLL